VLWINSAHVVTSDELDSTSCRPGLAAAIAKGPGLFKNTIWREDTAIWYGITDEMSDEFLFYGSLHFRFNLSRLRILDIRGFTWVKVSDGLHLGSSIGRCGWGCFSSLREGTATAIAHDWHWLAVIMVACCCDIHTADHSLELDQRVSYVVEVGRASLATGTEVGIVAYSTLVAVSNNIRRLVAAEWSIAVDTIVASLAKLSSTGIADWFINGDKAMSGVDEAGIDNACRAIVPVGAIKALMTDTKDVLRVLALHT
jgi:hypothetical protein